MIYLVEPNGRSRPFQKVYCRNEEAELQSLLENNLDLLPGSQINPGEPRRWLLLAKEFVIPDPGTGSARWYLDLLLVDQDGYPTLVECKRMRDTRARREVVAQMIDYAANCPSHLTRGKVLELIEQAARKKGATPDELLRELHPQSGDSIESFLDLVETNVNEGQLRLVFFLEEAPFELRSMVDFLNRQMQKTEVLLVEAALYELEGQRVVAPRLWGFTEEARRAKKAVAPKASAPAGEHVGEETLMGRIAEFCPGEIVAIRGFYSQLSTVPQIVIRPGGKSHVFETERFGRAFYLRENGAIEFALQERTIPEQTAFVEAFRRALGALPIEGIQDKLTKQYPQLQARQWAPLAPEVLAAFRDALAAAEAGPGKGPITGQ
jgi:hypothetical protein